MNMKKWMIVLLAVLLVILLGCGGYVIWKNTTNKSVVKEEKQYETYEETEAQLIPVNMSCEDKGIRVTVVGALLTEKYLWIEYDIHDLEGGRLNHNYIYDNAEDWLTYNTEFRDMGKSANFTVAEPDHCYIIQKYRHHMKEEADILSISMKSFPVAGKTNIPILPLLDQYGKTCEGEPLSGKNRMTQYPSNMTIEDLKVLDSNSWLEQPISDDPEMKNILLGGIGWIDDQLNIQVHSTDKNLRIEHSTGIFYSGPIMCRHEYRESGNYPRMACAAWDEDDDYNMDRMEFILLNCQQEDLEELNYSLDVTYIREILEGNWEFNIPLDQIRASADVAGEIDAILDPEESARMVYFEVYNGTGEAVMEFKIGDSTIGCVDDWDGWKGEGSMATGINAATDTRDSIPFSYKTESGYEYETTLPLSENIPRTVITMLPKAGGGGINVAYPEPEPTAVPAGS